MENIVTMNLKDFLEMHDAVKKLNEIKEFTLNSHKTYGDTTERDVYDIGHEVLRQLDIPLKREEEEDA